MARKVSGPSRNGPQDLLYVLDVEPPSSMISKMMPEIFLLLHATELEALHMTDYLLFRKSGVLALWCITRILKPDHVG